MNGVEIWADISGYVGRYQISNLGRVRAIIGKTRNGMSGERILKQDTSSPYCRIMLCSSNGETKRFPVHRLVASAFLPIIEGKDCVNHIDFNKRNNTVSNLEWCSRSENTQHSYRHKVLRRDKENNSMAKLTKEKVEKIRSLHLEGFSGKYLSGLFSVSQGTISCVVNGKTWV